MKCRGSATVVNNLGIHARPTAQLVMTACRFKDCEITLSAVETVCVGGKIVPSESGQRFTANAKSIMGVMMLSAGPGTVVDIECEGEGAEEALQAMIQVIESGFGEGSN